MSTVPRKISVIGLGYVGLTIAAAFGKLAEVIGYDKNKKRIEELKNHYDRNHEISTEQFEKAKIHYTSNPDDLKKADFHIIAVPTPLDTIKKPDFSLLLEATVMLGKQLKKKDIVVYESTVYPGATEEKCIPLLERTSKLKCEKEFGVGYSPERINPADKIHTFNTIPKIVSAVNTKILDIIADTYGKVVDAGTHRVSSMRIAEATKIIENTQRDTNISLINEIALILHCLGMDSAEVLAAARTKWNFLPFQPGLVGGHCIGVNSFYLAYKAEEAGYHPDVILAGRRVNDYMPKYLAEKTIKNLIHLGKQINGAKIAVFGLTYKENCCDMHDSRVLDLIKELETYETEILAYDPIADPYVAKKKYGINMRELEDIKNVDAIIFAVAHKQFHELSLTQINKILNRKGLIIDVKGILKPELFENTDIIFWRL